MAHSVSSSSGTAVSSDDLEAIPNASPAIGELGRQSTIVRASGLLTEDREAAVRARQRARTRSQVDRESRHRKNTDELTNERKCSNHLLMCRPLTKIETLYITTPYQF